MEAPGFLNEFLVVLVVATVVAYVFERFRIPVLLGFLLAGTAVGPNGFGWVSDIAQIHHLAELGVVLLMLTIGLEFSLDRIRGLTKLALFGGGLQILISISLGVAFASLKGWSFYYGFFIGAVVALSSTAIVFKYLIDRGEVDTHYGRIAVAILLMQDVAVVPLIILTSGFGTGTETYAAELGFAFLKVILLLIGVIILSKYILPSILRSVAVSRNREVFFLTSVVIGLGVSWIGAQLGLSFAIGAFFAGLMLANTEYGHQIMGEIVPFRYIFVSLFFVSIGLLFDAQFALDNIWLIMGVVGLVMVVNFIVVTLIVLGFGYPPRVAMAAGIILSQIGEFSFLLIETAHNSGSIEPFLYHLLLSASFITMLFTPFLFLLVPWILRLSEKQSRFGVHPTEWRKRTSDFKKIKNHIILCGFGTTGRDLAFSFQEEKWPFIVVEMNPHRLDEAKNLDYPCIYGDAANIELLHKAEIEHARAVVVSFRDQIGIGQLVRIVQNLNSDVLLVIRTRYETDVPTLYDLGADIVVIEEWEASLEMQRSILKHFGVPSDRIKKHLKRIMERKEILIESAIMKQIIK